MEIITVRLHCNLDKFKHISNTTHRFSAVPRKGEYIVINDIQLEVDTVEYKLVGDVYVPYVELDIPTKYAVKENVNAYSTWPKETLKRYGLK